MGSREGSGRGRLVLDEIRGVLRVFTTVDLMPTRVMARVMAGVRKRVEAPVEATARPDQSSTPPRAQTAAEPPQSHRKALLSRPAVALFPGVAVISVWAQAQVRVGGS